ncbi:hypothetical protein [Granulicoccus sp. GXG6511]|uniref:hypothetical protein n=1 Tax=Granulicoccus sp. GXG6511 TaxID=3381351 RepID=UPI003D7D38BE
MSQQWGPPPPPQGDPWGGAHVQQSGPDGQPLDPYRTMLGGTRGPGGPSGPPGPGQFPPAWPAPAPPRLWPTVVVTLFFGLFGLIPASTAAGRARSMNAPTGVYWRAFGITFGALMIVQALVLVFAVIPILRGQSLFAPRPASVAYDDQGAAVTPSIRPPGTQAPAAPVEPATTAPPSVPAQATTEPVTRTVTGLPSGSWITVLDSMPKNQRSEQEAWAMADGLSGRAQVVVVDSDRVAGLNGGYWAIAVTGSSSRNEANGWCSVLNRPVGGTCYPRQVS